MAAEAAEETWYSGPVSAVNLTPYTLSSVQVYALNFNGMNGNPYAISPYTLSPGESGSVSGFYTGNSGQLPGHIFGNGYFGVSLHARGHFILPGVGDTVTLSANSLPILNQTPSVSGLLFFYLGPMGIADAIDGVQRKRTPPDCGMPVWQVSSPYISLWLHDEPLGYQPALGSRISFELSFKQREFMAGWDPSVFSVGKGWNCSWLSYVTLDANSNAVVNLSGGGQTTFQGTNDFLTNARLSGNTTNGFTVSYPDGSQDVYGFVVTNGAGTFARAFLSERWNAQAQKTRFNYASYAPTNIVIRLQHVIDGDGRTNLISYTTNNAFSTNLISSVVDPFGRTTSLAYDSTGLLTNITDVAGLASSLAYNNSRWVTNLATPYGSTSFAFTDSTGTNATPNGRSVLVTEPDGSRQLFLYTNSAPGVASSYAGSAVPNTGTFSNLFDNSELNLRNSFHWGRRQFAALSTTNLTALTNILANLTANDYRKGRLQHWLKSGSNTVGDIVSLAREPSPDAGGTSEGPITWYDYTGKTNAACLGTQVLPLFGALVLPDGTTRFTRTERNALGAVTNEISTYTSNSVAALRTNTYTYATNLIDLVSATNALGVQVLSNSYNAYHQVLTNYNALGEMTVFTYDTSNRLSTISLPTGQLTTNAYGSDGFVAQTIATGISTNSFTYSNDLVRTHTDARGLTLTNEYDALQRLTRVSFPDGTFITNIYDKLDLVRTIDRMGYSNSFGFNAVRQLVAATNALGFYNLFDYCSCGSLNWSRDAANNYTYFFYDNAGRQTNVVYADGYAVTNFYNLLGQLTNVVDSAGTSVTNWFNNQGMLVTSSNVLGRISAATFDILDRATNTVDANGVTLTSTYDNLSRPLTRSYPDGGVERWAYTLNYAGPTSYTNQLGTNVVNYTYDLLGRKTHEAYPGIMTNQFAYNSASDLIQLTDGKNQTTTWGIDIYGRQTSKTNALGVEVARLTYDPNDNLLSRWTPAKGTTFYTNDALGNVTDINYPNSPDVALQYDSLNRLTNMTDAVGTNRYTYTAVGQLLSEDGPWANDTLSYTYNNRLRASLSLQQPSGTWTNGYLYDAIKRMTNLTSPAGAFGYQYPNNQPSTLIQQLSLPGGSYITNTYDSVTRLLSTQLKNSGGTVLNSHAYGYNLVSQRTTLTNTPGDYRNYTYDNSSQLKTALGYESDGSPRLNEKHGYAYDAAGNLNYRTNNAFVQTFAVNSLNELSNMTRSGTLTVAGNTTTGATNVTVNALTATRYADNTFAREGFPLVDGTTNFTAIAANSIGLFATNIITVNLATTNSFVYDLNGNLRTNGTQVFEYDDVNRLATNWVAGNWKSEFVYDGASRRRIQRDYGWSGGVWVKTNEVRLVYDGNAVLQHRDTNNDATLTLTRGLDILGSREDAGGIGGLLAMTESSGTSSYYHSDGGGNVTALINASQLLVGKYIYDPFGSTLAINGPKASLNPYRFSSKPIHELSGHYDFLYRWYAPDLQRWLNLDLIGEAGGLNLYRFVGNNPGNAFDPLGLVGLDPLEQLDWHHIFVQKYKPFFDLADIDIHDPRYGLMLSRDIHIELHRRGYVERWDEFFDVDKVRTKREIQRFANKLAKGEFKEFFQLGVPATRSYKPWLGRTGKALGALGILGSLASISASAETIACNLKNFVEDRKQKKDDWAYVDALTVRHELNQHGLFAGDIAMRAMYKGSD